MLLPEANGTASVELIPLYQIGLWFLAENQFETRPLRHPATRSDIWVLSVLVRVRPSGGAQVFERADNFAVERWLTFADGLLSGAARSAELLAETGQFGLQVGEAGEGDLVEVEVSFEGIQWQFHAAVAAAVQAGASMRAIWAGLSWR